MTPATIIAIVSVFIGFALFTGSFLSFMGKKPALMTWGFFVAAIIFLTVVPLSAAVFVASSGN